VVYFLPPDAYKLPLFQGFYLLSLGFPVAPPASFPVVPARPQSPSLTPQVSF